MKTIGEISYKDLQQYRDAKKYEYMSYGALALFATIVLLTMGLS